VDELEQRYKGQAHFKRINAVEGDGPAIMEQYHIPGHPTLLLFNAEGQEQERFIGPQSEETIEIAIQQIISRG